MSEPRVPAETFGEIALERAMRRREFLGAALSAGAAAALGCLRPPARAGAPEGPAFPPLPGKATHTHAVAAGRKVQVLLRWGDPVLAAPAFDPEKPSAEAQRLQFGYNCDFTAFLPLPRGSNASDRGLLCVNHEYTDAPLMFPPGLRGDPASSRRLFEVELAAHGHSVVEVRRGKGGWERVADSRLNRRVTAETPMRLSGPAAGHPRLRTSKDPTGAAVLGTIANCSGGVTPWGTVLIAEENFGDYFAAGTEGPEAAAWARYGLKKAASYDWPPHDPRFDCAKEPNECNRFGWVVELDPHDPGSTPVKRTALGRFEHEAANTALSHDGRVVVYMGDDDNFEHLYKFVSAEPYDPSRPGLEQGLLDRGTLYAARFDSDGSVRWLPLTHGAGPLTPANGFASQADVLIEARRAASLLGATPMDRPEDVEADPRTGRVYVVLTKNDKRRPEQADAANPRAGNKDGHVLELRPPLKGGRPDHGAESHGWELLLLAGDPAREDAGARYPGPVAGDDWLSCPDNCAVDPRGRLWLATDGANDRGMADAVHVLDLDGPRRGVPRRFFNAPLTAEVCGPSFTPDGRTLFLCVQHPGEGSTYEAPSTRWPDFGSGPPRPALVAIEAEGRGELA